MKPNRIPSLDGLRAISILMVVAGHATASIGYPRRFFFLGHYAPYGVRVFFVISGFLITSLLLGEIERTGTASLKDFYVRRAYRILPAAYVFTIVTAIVCHHWMDWLSTAGALFYFENWLPNPAWPVGHLWSLSVEEQFYLLWPFLLVACFRHRAKILIGAILVAPIVRVILLLFHQHRAVTMWFPSVQDSLAIGCLLAVFREKAAKIGAKLDRFIVPILLITVVMPVLRYPFGVYFSVVVSLMNLGIAICIENFTRKPPRILNWKPVVWIGTLSYSIYLVQMPFFTPGINNMWTRFPMCVIAILPLAMLLHYGVEKPFLQLRALRSQKARSADVGPQAVRSEVAHRGLDMGVTAQPLSNSQVDAAS